MILLNLQKKSLNINDGYEKNLLQEIKEKFSEWCAFSTTHGIPNISRSDSFVIKIIWFLCLIGSSSYCFYLIVQIFVSYFSFGVLISIKVLEKTPVDFPAVTVCNLNPLDRRYSQNYIDKIFEKHNLTYLNNISLVDLNLNAIKYLIKANINSDKNLTMEIKRSFGFEISFMLLTCFFNGIKCNSSDFIWTYDFDYGNCFTFNSGFDQNGNKIPIRQINEPGSDRSFKLELFLGDEFTQGIFMQQSGARVVVHNQSITPLIEAEGKELSTNYQSDIGIKRSFISKLEKPYSNCVKQIYSSAGYDSDFYRAMFTILNMTRYRQKNCARLCLQRYIKQKCDCIDPKLPNIYGDLKVCSNLKDLNCISQCRMNYSKMYDSCLECPLECDSGILK